MRKKTERERGRGRGIKNKEQRLGFASLYTKICAFMPQRQGASASQTREQFWCQRDALVLFCLNMSGNVTLCSADPLKVQSVVHNRLQHCTVTALPEKPLLTGTCY